MGDEEAAKKKESRKRIFIGGGSSYEPSSFFEEKKEDFEFEIVDQEENQRFRPKNKKGLDIYGALNSFILTDKEFRADSEFERAKSQVPEDFDYEKVLKKYEGDLPVKIKKPMLGEKPNTEVHSQVSKKAEHAIMAGFHLGTTAKPFTIIKSKDSQSVKKEENLNTGETDEKVEPIFKGEPKIEEKIERRLEDLKKRQNSRRKEPWAPSALLCTRFGVRQPRFTSGGSVDSKTMVSSGFSENFRFK